MECVSVINLGRDAQAWAIALVLGHPRGILSLQLHIFPLEFGGWFLLGKITPNKTLAGFLLFL